MRGLRVSMGVLAVVVATSGCSVKSDFTLQDQMEIVSLKQRLGLSQDEIDALRESNANAAGRIENLELELASLATVAATNHVDFESGVDENGADTGMLRVPDMLLFPPGSAHLSAEGAELLSVIGGRLTELEGFLIRVEGHADSNPILGAKYASSNWNLSAARSLTVVHAMLNQFDLDPRLMEAVGCGEFRPVANNSTPEGRRVNRRVEIHLTRPPAFAYLQR